MQFLFRHRFLKIEPGLLISSVALMVCLVSCRILVGALVRPGVVFAYSGATLSVKWSKVEQRSSSPRTPAGRIPAGAVSCQGAFFIFGGETDDKSKAGPNKYLNDLWKFTPDPADNRGTWTELSSDGLAGTPARRVSSSMVCSQEKLIIFGGLARHSVDDTHPLSDVWSFDLQRSTWQQIMQNASVEGGPGDRCCHTATVVDNEPDKMIVFGGWMAEGGATSDQTWIYSISGGRWREVRSSFRPGKRDFHTSVGVPSSTEMKMWGGIDDKALWSFNAQTEIWSSVSSDLAYESGRIPEAKSFMIHSCLLPEASPEALSFMIHSCLLEASECSLVPCRTIAL